jgi:molybdenum cofactor cytidylyltransferase
MRITRRVFLLAAGRGIRAGGPKAWLPCGGSPLLERQVRFLQGIVDPGEVFVSIQSAWEPRCRAIHAGVRWVPADPDAPALASLQRLLASARPGPWAFLFHVDMPLWDEGIFRSLSRAVRGGIDAAVPVHAGRRGHPVLLSPGAQSEIAGLDPARDRLDAWLRGRRVREVETPRSCALENWNEGRPAGLS